MAKHTKLFYRAVERIRALNIKNGSVLVQRIKTVYKTSFRRAFMLKFELEEAGVIRAWNSSDVNNNLKSNILWKNLNKFRVPKEITKQERLRARQELKAGKIPETLAKE